MTKKLPSNRVGHHIPDDNKITMLMAAIHLIREESILMGPMLNTTERRKLSKPRTNYEPISQEIARLSEKQGVNARHAKAQDIRNDLELVKKLSGLLQEMSVAYECLRDIYRQARSEAWESSLVFYDILSAAANSDPVLAGEMKAIFDFMSNKTASKVVDDAPAIGGTEDNK